MVKNTHNRESFSGDLLMVLFENPQNVKIVYNNLLNEGYPKDDITIIMTEETEKRYFSNQDLSKTDLGNKSLEGMGVGGAFGGTAGAIAAGIAALGTSLIIPGLGIVVGGAFAAALAGAGAGAITGGLVGALVGLGVPSDQAEEFEEGIKAGGVVIGVHTRTPENYKLLNQKWQAYKSTEIVREDFIR